MPSPGGSTHAGHHADQLAGRTDHLVAWHGPGIGTALLVDAQSRILARGCARCCVGASPGNIVAARLYARLGYRRTGVRYIDRYQLPAAGGAVTRFADEVDVLVKDLGGAV
ncbi:MAG: GNAT family N-acetyltransferase [Mycobacteriales bacterium]